MKSPGNKFFSGGVLLSVLVGISLYGCVITRDQQFESIDKLVKSGKFHDAAEMVQEERDALYHKRDRLLFYLEAGMLAFYQEDYTSAIKHLNVAERLIEETDAVDISQELGSFFVGDSVRMYSGEGYENLYVNTFKALSFIMLNDYEGAFVEVRRMDIKLRLLEQKYQREIAQYNAESQRVKTLEGSPSVFLYGSALPRLLSLMMYRSEDNRDDARIDREKLQIAMDLQPRLYSEKLPSEIGKLGGEENILTVFAHTGLIPLKEAVSLQVVVSSGGLFISAVDSELAPFMDTIGSLQSSVSNGLNSFRIKVEIPYLVPRSSDISRVHILINNQMAGYLFPLESLERIALLNHERRLPLLILKSVTTALIKGISSSLGSQEAARMGGEGVGALVNLLAQAMISISQTADLRVARYFPATVFVGEYHLEEADSYIVKMEFMDFYNRLVDVQEYYPEPAKQMMVVGNSLR